MTRTRDNRFISKSFAKRLNSMLRVDSRRMFTTPLFYIMCGIAFAMPILILVMTTMTAGTTIDNPQTGAQTTMDMFTNTWQIIASEGGNMFSMAAPAADADMAGGAAAMGMNMDMTAMCNINLLYFMAGVFVCLFVSEDFRSGYAKNLFTVRARKTDYVASKTIVGFIAGAMFLICFFVGAVIGGSVAGLSFDLGAAGVSGLVMCMLAKIFLMSVFVAIFLIMSVIGKHRAWMSILLSLFLGMLLFMMIPMMTPLDSTVVNVGMTLVGGAIFSVALGAVSNMILKKSSLV